MSYESTLLKHLIPLIEQYAELKQNDNLCEFSLYLKDEVFKTGESDVQVPFNKANFDNYKVYREVEFSTLLTGLFRFAKHYLKKAFADGSINTIDEFGFLATLLKEGSMPKNELINKHLLEISSGSEIIKRLVKSGLIEELQSDTDKRQRLVTLTAEGRIALMAAFDDMHKVSEIVIGNLTSEEIKSALLVFRKLTFFHQHIHETDKNTSLDELHQKFANGSGA